MKGMYNHLSCRRNYSTHIDSGDNMFYSSRNYFESDIHEMKKQISLGIWPGETFSKKLEKELKELQRDICYLSSVSRNQEALALIEKYTFHIGVRYLAIRKVKIQSGGVPGTDKFILANDLNCIVALNNTKFTKIKK
jgi:hypothetical protein